MKEQFVICITEHPLWGYVLQPTLVKETANGFLSIVEVADKNSSYFTTLTEPQQELVLFSEKYAEKKLMKNYSKEKTLADFRKKVTKDVIDKYIRPVIELSHRKMIAVIQTEKIPLYYRKDVKIRALYDTEKITVESHVSKAIFNFTRNEQNELSYYVQVQSKDSVINLNSRFFAVICNDPAIVVVDNDLLVFDDIDAKKLLPFFTKDVVRVPANSYKTYVEKFVAGCVQKYDVNATGFEIKEVDLPKQASLVFSNNFNMLPVLTLSFYYGAKKYQLNEYAEDKIVFAEEKDGEVLLNYFYRDKPWENSMIHLLLNNGLSKNSMNEFYLSGQEDKISSIIEWIRENQEILNQFEFTQSFQQVYFLGEIETAFQVEEKQDWFDIYGEVIFGKFRIPFIKFRHNIINNIREYVLPDDSVAILPDAWFVRFADIMHFGKKDDEHLHLQKQNFRLLEPLQEVTNPKKEITVTEDLAVPEEIKVTLRHYQQKGFSWLVNLYKNNFGGCLADDMGLGKTLQTIAMLQYVANENKKQPEPVIQIEAGMQMSLFQQPESYAEKNVTSLVVVPTSLLFNWRNELKRFAPMLRVCPYSGSKRERNKRITSIFKHYDVVITTYGTLRNDIELLSLFEFHHLILDESQYVKNPDSVTYKAVKQINAKHKLSLTGTPIENSLTDLWAQFNLINEGMLGSYTSFKKRYVNAIEKKDEEKEAVLLRMIQPFMLRRTKREVAPELPPLTEEVVYCDMTKEQEEVYQKEKNKLRKSLIIDNNELDIQKMAFLTLQGLTHLRLLANHPRFVDEEYSNGSGKFEQVMMYIETLIAEKHKVLIFSSFVRHLRLFAEHFNEKKWKYAWLTGETAATDREKEIDKFMQQDDVNCFFISLKAGGVGLNLTEADYVFILDPWWNPAAEMQAIARSHRIGQKKNVMVYRFISTGTIEEKIRRLQESKSILAEKFVTSANPISNMNKQEIEELFN